MQMRLDENPLLFTVGGVIQNEDQFRAAAQKPRPRPKAIGAASFHKGWSVEGFPPGFIERAEQQRREDIDHWRSMSAERRAQRLKEGGREPAAWDTDRFVNNTKRQKVRNRPFEVEAASQDALELAVKTGWTHVRIVELSKGRAAQPGLF